VLTPDNTVQVRQVKIGSQFGEFRVIEQGVAADERVVINGIQRALPNAKVNPTEVVLDVSSVRVTAPGSAATQALPSTRMTPSTAPATRPTTQPTARQQQQGGVR
jgi:hypothetical protein